MLPESFRVLFVSGIGGATRRYRCAHLQEQLALEGIESALREANDAHLLTEAMEYDLFILHRVPFTPLIEHLVEIAHLRGKPVVFETDDLLFDPATVEHITFIDGLSPQMAYRFRTNLARMAETFRRADCLLTTTTFLAEQGRRFGKTAYVHRNGPSAAMFHLAEAALAERKAAVPENDETVVLAYFSGTASHERDFRTIVEPLSRILRTYPHVWLHIGGYLELDEALRPFWPRIRQTPFVSWKTLPSIIAGTDINLVPLEADNPFCQAKSEIKFLEAALVGVPTIATPVGAYAHVIDNGVNGLLADTPEDWFNAMQQLIEGAALRRSMGEAARRTVYESYTPAKQAKALIATLEAITTRFGGSAIEPTALESRFITSIEHYAASMEAEREEREQQIAELRHTLRQYEAHMAAMKRQIDRVESTLQQIQAGRVMRLMTGLQRRWRRLRGRRSHSERQET